MYVVMHEPPNQPPIHEGYDTEPEAEARAKHLINGKRYHRVVIYEISDGEEVA